ncbi:MAG: CPBP family intramembrane glutamic endopeptidase [Bacteroidota bacterium]
MNLFYIRLPWYIELLLLTIGMLGINISVVHIGYINIWTIILCQLINLAGFVGILWLARNHLIRQNQDKKDCWFCFLRRKLKPEDIFWIILIVVLSKITTSLVSKIDFLTYFDFKIFKGFSLGHISEKEQIISAVFFGLVLTLGVFAEEFYFRGYLFELQYKTFKKYTWMINGISWSFFHLFSPTNFIVILPQCLIYSYVYQKRRNIWITIVAHLISNYLVLFSRVRYMI